MLYIVGLTDIFHSQFCHVQIQWDQECSAHICGNHIKQLVTDAASCQFKTFFSSYMAENCSYKQLSERMKLLIFYTISFGTLTRNNGEHPAHYEQYELQFPFAIGTCGSYNLRVIANPLMKTNQFVPERLSAHKHIRVVTAYPV